MKNTRSDEFATEQTLNHKLFLQREYCRYHLPYERELDFYTAVRNGDIQLIEKIMLPLKNEQLGRLSNNPLKNLKYHLIITIAMITRFCIEGGMEPETAYTLSDIYIQKVDVCRDEDEINELHKKVSFDFARKMRSTHKKTTLSRATIIIEDYIYDHLHEKISLDQFAEATGLNKTYLCELFKNEIGITIGDYIKKQKIDAAKQMLIYTEYSATAIGNYLAFSSHSYFISVFKKETGMTPGEYQKKGCRTFFGYKNNVIHNK